MKVIEAAKIKPAWYATTNGRQMLFEIEAHGPSEAARKAMYEEWDLGWTTMNFRMALMTWLFGKILIDGVIKNAKAVSVK
jgi:hypothetical protein